MGGWGRRSVGVSQYPESAPQSRLLLSVADTLPPGMGRGSEAKKKKGFVPKICIKSPACLINFGFSPEDDFADVGRWVGRGWAGPLPTAPPQPPRSVSNSLVRSPVVRRPEPQLEKLRGWRPQGGHGDPHDDPPERTRAVCLSLDRGPWGRAVMLSVRSWVCSCFCGYLCPRSCRCQGRTQDTRKDMQGTAKKVMAASRALNLIGLKKGGSFEYGTWYPLKQFCLLASPSVSSYFELTLKLFSHMCYGGNQQTTKVVQSVISEEMLVAALIPQVAIAWLWGGGRGGTRTAGYHWRMVPRPLDYPPPPTPLLRAAASSRS